MSNYDPKQNKGGKTDGAKRNPTRSLKFALWVAIASFLLFALHLLLFLLVDCLQLVNALLALYHLIVGGMATRVYLTGDPTGETGTQGSGAGSHGGGG